MAADDERWVNPVSRAVRIGVVHGGGGNIDTTEWPFGLNTWGATEWLSLLALVVTVIAWRWSVKNTRQTSKAAQQLLETQRRAVLSIEPDANGVAITFATTRNPPGYMSFRSRVRNTGQFRAINIEPEVLYDGKPIRVQQFPQALQPDGVGVPFHFDLPVTGEQLPSASVRLRATFEDGNETSVPMDECFFIDHVAYSKEAGGQPYTSRPCSAPS